MLANDRPVPPGDRLRSLPGIRPVLPETETSRAVPGVLWDWSPEGDPMTHQRVRVALVCDNCGKRFTLMPADARARMKNKHVFHSFACRTEWLRKQKEKG